MANRFSDRKEYEKQHRYMDNTLIFVIIFLLAFGLVMIFSTSSYQANLDYGNSTHFFVRQLFAEILGLAFMIVAMLIPYHWYEKIATFGYFFSIVLILLIIPFGYEVKGAKRWFRIGGLSLQPAEVAKVAMIIFLASVICKMGTMIQTNKGFTVVMALAAVVGVLLWKITDNMSSGIIVVGIAFLMLFVASPDYKKFIVLILIAATVAALMVFIIARTADPSQLGFRGARVLAWLDPEAYADGKGFQTLQALYAIGSGGLLGKGLGQSIQKLGFLPEAQNDMIFSIICEELGLLGGIMLLALFLILIWRLMVIASNAPDLYGTLLVVGVMGHVAIQVILNVAVVTNTIINTGISLPFISYGGTAVMFQLIELGIAMSVGRSIIIKE